MRINISLEEALKILLEESSTMEAIEVPILEALNNVLAEDIIAEINMPPFKKSSLDGYAVNAIDIENATKELPVLLRVVDFVAAGHLASKKLGKQEAIRIMTGAKLPEGADVVIGFEEIKSTEDSITIYNSYPSNTNIAGIGTEIKQGETVLKKGTLIEPLDIGILATLGKTYIKVFRRPIIAILSTGDELIDIKQPLVEGKIRNSNSYAMAALVKQNGGEPLMLGMCQDDIQIIKEKLESAFTKADMIITTGGVAGGDCDLVKEAFLEVGAEMLFWKTKIKAGKYMAVAKKQNKLLIGLSGKPAAAYTAFDKFIKPVISKARGI